MNDSIPKARDYKLFRASTRLQKPISDATHHLEEISFLVLRIYFENGVTGESYLLSFQYSPAAIRGALRDLLPLVSGTPANEMAALHDKIRGITEYFGNEGIHSWVQGLVNIAMWDGWARSLGQPVHKLLGTVRDEISLYGSGGWLSYSIEELIEEVTGYLDKGYRAVKIKVGSPDWTNDVERLRQVRLVTGSGARIMMDANQGMDVASACRLAIAARELDIFWFEEPVNRKDFDGYQTIKSVTGISLAMGEREFDTHALRELARRRAIDIWQPDILRLGGVQSWLESAAIAGGHHLPVLPHYYKDYDVPLLCTIANGEGAESFHWIDELIDEPLVVQEGKARARQGAGWGFRFLDEKIEEIRL